jgi:hypothetical protein
MIKRFIFTGFSIIALSAIAHAPANAQTPKFDTARHSTLSHLTDRFQQERQQTLENRLTDRFQQEQQQTINSN